jgi:hypothetical protein
MSFAMTTEQVRNQTKDVTRRFGWWFLKPGDKVWAVEKSMGIPAGEKIKRIGMIEVISTRAEPLNAITTRDCSREGFPHYTPNGFVQMLVDHFGIDHAKECNRIEFRYIAEGGN